MVATFYKSAFVLYNVSKLRATENRNRVSFFDARYPATNELCDPRASIGLSVSLSEKGGNDRRIYIAGSANDQR